MPLLPRHEKKGVQAGSAVCRALSARPVWSLCRVCGGDPDRPQSAEPATEISPNLAPWPDESRPREASITVVPRPDEDRPSEVEEMNVMENRVIGRAISEARQTKGLSIKEAAAAVGVQSTLFSSWQAERGRPSYASALKLDEVLGTELIKLFGPLLRGTPKTARPEQDAASPPAPRSIGEPAPKVEQPAAPAKPEETASPAAYAASPPAPCSIGVPAPKVEQPAAQAEPEEAAMPDARVAAILETLILADKLMDRISAALTDRIVEEVARRLNLR